MGVRSTSTTPATSTTTTTTTSPTTASTGSTPPVGTTTPTDDATLVDEQAAADDVTDVVNDGEVTSPPADAPDAGGTDAVADGGDMDWVFEAPDATTGDGLPSSAGEGTVDSQGSAPESNSADWREFQSQSATQDFAQAMQAQDPAAASAALDVLEPIVQRSSVDTVDVVKENAKEDDKKAVKQEIHQQLDAEEVFIKQDAQKLKKMEGLVLRQQQIAKKQGNAKAQAEWSTVLERVRGMQKEVGERKKAFLNTSARTIFNKWETLKGAKKELVGGETAKPETAEDKAFNKFFKKMAIAGDFLITSKQEKEHAKNVEEREAAKEANLADDKEKTPADKKEARKKDKTEQGETAKTLREAKKVQRGALARPSEAHLQLVGEKMKEHFAKIGRTFVVGAQLMVKGDKKAGKADQAGAPATGVEADEGFSISGLFAKVAGIFGNTDETDGGSSKEDKSADLQDHRTAALGAFQFVTQGRQLTAYQPAQTVGRGTTPFSKTAGAGDPETPTGQDAVAALGVTTGGGSQVASSWQNTNEQNPYKKMRDWSVGHWPGTEDGEVPVSKIRSTDGLNNDVC